MKNDKNGIRRIGVGAILLLTTAVTAGLVANSANASVIVGNLSDTLYAAEYAGAGNNYLAQDFTTGSSSVVLGALSLKLTLTGTQTVSVYLFNTSAAVPSGTGQLLGTYTGSGSGNDLITLSATPTLSASTTYAIALLDPSANIEWDATTTSGTEAGSSGTMGTDYYLHGSTWQGYLGGVNFQMEADSGVVPEVPGTGIFMSFGALTVAGASMLRRKAALFARQ